LFTPPTSGTLCTGEPQVYKIKVMKMGLCNGIDPSGNNPLPDIAANCVETFNSGASSISVTVKNGTSSPIAGGTLTKPANGTYNYGYLIMEPEIAIKVSQSFSTPVYYQPGTSNSGDKCWTTGQTFDPRNPPDSSANPLIQCSNTMGTAQTEVMQLTTLNCKDPYMSYHCSYEGDPSLDDSYAYVLKNGVLLPEDGNLIVTPNMASGFTSVATFSKFKKPVVITDLTSGMELQVRVSQGMKLDHWSIPYYTGGTADGVMIYPQDFKIIFNIQ